MDETTAMSVTATTVPTTARVRPTISSTPTTTVPTTSSGAPTVTTTTENLSAPDDITTTTTPTALAPPAPDQTAPAADLPEFADSSSQLCGPDEELTNRTGTAVKQGARRTLQEMAAGHPGGGGAGVPEMPVMYGFWMMAGTMGGDGTDYDAAPMGRSFVIEGPLATSDGDFEVSITWSPPTGSCAHHYVVLLSMSWKQAGLPPGWQPEPGELIEIILAPDPLLHIVGETLATEASLILRGLLPDTQYNLWVVPFDAAGNPFPLGNSDRFWENGFYCCWTVNTPGDSTGLAQPSGAGRSGGSIEAGQSVSGYPPSTGPGRWTFLGVAGSQVRIDLASSEFDAYLELEDPSGTVVATDDDGGFGSNASITTELCHTGTYTIVADSFKGFWSGVGGDYTLSLEDSDTEVVACPSS